MKFLRGLVVSFLLVLGLGVLLVSYLSLPVSSNTPSRPFVINQGDSAATIGTRLEENGFIRDRLIFIIQAYRLNLNHRLLAGNFTLSPSMSTSQIVVKLSQGGTKDYWLKIIDGSRLEEIAPSFTDTAIDPQSFLAAASGSDGYLFPDSYLIPTDYTSDQVLSVIKQNFNQKLAEAKSGATNTSMSDSEIITLASLLEREGRTIETKQMIAGILLNRLAAGMPLQVDASVQYARDTLRHPAQYWQPLSKSDLQIISPYNTYQNPGLPPTPICNPGYNSLSAAFHPTASSYLYYLTDSSGVMHYAATLAQHNANIAKFLK